MSRYCKIKTPENIFGEVQLSGDTDIAICSVMYALFHNRSVQFINLPRSEKFLKFFSSLKHININPIWSSESNLIIKLPKEIKDDISFLNKSDDFDIARLLLVYILIKNGVCILNPEQRSEAKFYRKIGFDISAKGENLKIIKPMSSVIDQQEDISNEDIYGYLSRIMLKESGFYDIKYSGENQNKFYEIKKDYFNDIILKSPINCRYSKKEFNLFFAMARKTNSEINISNIDLKEMIESLSLFSQFGIRFEVSGNKLKLWKEDFEAKLYYDISQFEPDLIGYILTILSFEAKNPVNILIKDNPVFKSIVTDLNILGAKISYSDEENSRNYSLLRVKPSELNSAKNMHLDLDWGGVLIFASLFSNGVSTFDNLLEYGRYFYKFIDNLTNLGIEVR